MTVVRAPAVVLEARDCRWLASVLSDLIARGYFAGTPGLAERAAEIAMECQGVADGGQTPLLLPGVADDRLMTYGEAARALRMSTRTLRRRVAAREIPVVRIGGLVRFRPVDLREVS